MRHFSSTGYFRDARQILSPEQQDKERAKLELFFSKQSLANFTRFAWPTLEPSAEYVHNWHIDAVSEHLEAVTYGWLNRLLINVPPGSMKSLLASVMWPAWEWGPKDLRSLRYIATAFNDGPIKRDTRKMRNLVLSPWYQNLFPRVKLLRYGETSFENSYTGSREGIPFMSLTSQRGDRLIIDDPHSTKTAESDVERAKTVLQFREGALNRLNDQEKSAIVVIMQRLHEGDISGEILASEMGFEHLCIPMEYEPERQCVTSVGFSDPRTEDGELMFPARFPAATVKALKKDMGDHAWAGQYQQRPSAREGSMFKLAWFANRFIGAAPPGTVWWRHWDLAGTKNKTSARTAGVLMGRTPDGRYVVGDSVLLQEEGHVVRQTILATAQKDGRNVSISLPQDPGQAGKVQKSDLIAMLAGYNVAAEPETGDKAHRAQPFSVQCEAGNVYIVRADWNAAYVGELIKFPGGKFKDQVDASSGAFGRLVTNTSPTPVFGSYGS